MGNSGGQRKKKTITKIPSDRSDVEIRGGETFEVIS